MKQAQHLLFAFLLLATISTYAQNVGIGTTTPPAKLTVLGSTSNPSIPGIASTGTFRIGVAPNEGIDFGKMGLAPFAGWIQAGYNGTTVDPLSLQPSGGNVGIGTATPNVSAQLDVSSTTKGFLPPRMTTVQRDAITSPATGLVIFNTNANSLQLQTSSGWGSLTTTAVFLPTIVIGTQQWMRENLDVLTYRNGDIIPQVTDATAWAALTTGAWCYYNNDVANGAIYGKLYNWYAVNDSRGLAPTGWHVPSDAEWTTLSATLGGDAVAGGKMKTTGITRWTTPNTGATNESGFAGLPGGFRDGSGTFNSVGGYGFWWSSTEFTAATAWYRYLFYNFGTIYRFDYGKRYGFSVRCLRD